MESTGIDFYDDEYDEIEIEVDPVGFIGCSARIIVYPFNYNESAKCYLYN